MSYMKFKTENITDWDNYETSEEYTPQFSVRHKRKINRLFREEIGSKSARYPEVDNWFERVRSKIVRYWLVKNK